MNTTIVCERYEIGKGGGLVKIDTSKVSNLPLGTVLHWGGNMGNPERDVCIVGINPDTGYGGSYCTYELPDHGEPANNANLGHVDFSSVKMPDDPGVWHTQHYFVTGETRTAAEVLAFLGEHKRQADALAAHLKELEADKAVKLADGRVIFARLWPKDAKYAIVAELIVDDSDIMTDYFADHAESTVVIAPSMHDKNNFAEMRKACKAIPETACMMTGKGDFRVMVVADSDFQNNGCTCWKGCRSHWHRELDEEGDGHLRKFETRADAQAFIDAAGKPYAVGPSTFSWKIEENDIEHRENYSGGKGYYLQRDGQPWRVRKVGVYGYRGTDKEPSEGFLLWLADRSGHLTKGETESARAGVPAFSDGVVAVAGLTENAEKGGLELRFHSRPSSEVLDALKAGGWRWSKFSSCWWIKASEEARELAQRLTATI